MLDLLGMQFMAAAQEAVTRSVGQEAPATGLTLVLDLRHHLARILAPRCGLSQGEIDAEVRRADERGGLPWVVCWVTAEDAIRLFACRGEAAASAARRLLARARSEGSHAVALFIEGRDNVPLLTVRSGIHP